MEGTKLNSGIVAVLIIASIFAGWQTALIVLALLLLFGHLEDSMKKVLATILTFLAGIALFNLAWTLVVEGFDLVHNGFVSVVDILNLYAKDPIMLTKIELYFFAPVGKVISLGDSVIQYAILVLKFLFILSVIANRKLSKNFIFNKIYSYVDKFTNYVSSFASQPAYNVNPNDSMVSNINNNYQNPNPPNNGM